MRRSFFLFLITLLLFGCSHLDGKTDGILTTYPRDTFINTTTGETGLLINGESWYTLINLSGFTDTDKIFTSPNQFLFQKSPNGMMVSIFAEKFDRDMDSESCLNCYLSRTGKMANDLSGKVKYKSYTREYRDKKIIIRDASAVGMTARSINYYAAHSGYCFDFHFSGPATEDSIQQALKCIDSIEFKNDQPSNIRMSRYFYIYAKRLKLSFPGEWNCSLQKADPPDHKLSSIIFKSVNNTDFTVYISPLKGFGPKKETPYSVKQIALNIMSRGEEIAAEKLFLQEIISDDMIIYYYDITDKYCNPNDPKDFPNIRQGFVLSKGAVLYFSIFFKDDCKFVSKQGLDVILESRMIDLL